MMIANNHPFLRFSRKETSRTIRSVLRGERRSSVALTVVFTHHGYMRRLNKQFLKHDYSTDVIAFSVDEESGFDGEIYVNLDKVRSQARHYGVAYGNETMRLLIHGTLHLLGYVDKTKAQKATMKKKEDYYLEKLGERA
ncbi:MAG TPA: rRNA maturation RNase YbeY [Bacteroidota bacterium]|nr:rRNA maturation RNase YbeY [Bacteroidota bacterium]